MRLDQWLNEKGIGLAEFGAMIGKSAPTVSRFARGLGNPDLSTMVEIERVTNGAVRPDDFLRSREPNKAIVNGGRH